jgi:hypothetical protein
MFKCDHEEHKVCETRLRSMLKGATAKLIEVTADFILMDIIFGQPEKSFAVALGLEIFCYICGYWNERIWNKINWGRKVVDIVCDKCRLKRGNVYD